ncbi:MAG: rhodanese-like domain-containing protein [Pseudomonadota bacterium]
MKKLLLIALVVMFALGTIGLAAASDKKEEDPLAAGEKAVHGEFKQLIPKDKWISNDDFAKVQAEVLAGKRKAYLLDIRSHPEFYAGHIPGTDHIHAGHMYTIPGKIKDPNAEIYVICRTTHRSPYVAGFLYKYGYKNVYVVQDGVVGWMKAGRELCNQFMGKFKVVEYHKDFSGPDKDPFRVREFHPY